MEFTKIADFPNYEINQFGDIRRCCDKAFLAQEVIKKYKRVHLYKDGQSFHRLVHRLVAQTFLENPLNQPTVDHIDRNKFNNHISNLKWASRSEQNLNRGSPLKGTNTQEHHIYYNSRDDAYIVQVQKNFKKYKKQLKQLDDAKAFRDSILSSIDGR